MHAFVIISINCNVSLKNEIKTRIHLEGGGEASSLRVDEAIMAPI